MLGEQFGHGFLGRGAVLVGHTVLSKARSGLATARAGGRTQAAPRALNTVLCMSVTSSPCLFSVTEVQSAAVTGPPRSPKRR
ncbi:MULTISPECIES: hypothetical protein [unclassified Amycolatopsis]|uniref:hypothetical protein n=1 Tax=unclassified Amycolatopsis TaxID=2618356 RepID=UPI001C6A8BF8|nr:hypothetical protein [Amycolatopsis sp. DSM 110486]QYN26669.1 hypothetical protein K1T34_21010 [Amycolatopsis sp. DSM 110486]